MRELLALLFEEDGWLVRTAANGAEALDVLRGWQPHLILLDLMMPVMDGRTFRAEQRRRGVAVDVPLVVLSAARDASAQAEQFGAITVIQKPFDITTILEVASRILNPSAT